MISDQMILNWETSIYQLLNEQAQKNPDRIAIKSQENSDVCAQYPCAQVTYRELLHMAAGIEALLRRKGFHPGNVVGVDSVAPIQMIAATLAILKAGGIFFPVDPSYPQKQNELLLANFKVEYLLTDQTGWSGDCHLKDGAPRIIHIEEAGSETPDLSSSAAPVRNCAGSFLFHSPVPGDDLAGVILSERKILQWVRFTLEKLKAPFNQTLFRATPGAELRFPLWIAGLITGGAVHLYHQTPSSNIAHCAGIIDQEGVSGMVLSLADLKALMAESGYQELFRGNTLTNLITFGEEVFDGISLKDFIKSKGIKWHNFYGFPEIQMVTGLVESAGVSTGAMEISHTGKPVAGAKAYLMDETGSALVPIGSPGLLFLSGNGIMDEYLNQETLNNSLFLKSEAVPGERLYRTGYRAVWLPDGRISFLQRNDGVIRLNGCKTTTEFLEKAVLKSDLVDECAVVLKKSGEFAHVIFEKPLVYIVSKHEFSPDKMAERLKLILPERLLPLGLVRLPALPRLPDGSIDKRALEALDYLDTLQIREIETTLRTNHLLQSIAILAGEAPSQDALIHVTDLFPKPIGDKSRKLQSIPDSAIQSPETGAQGQPPALRQGEKLIIKEDDPATLDALIKRTAAKYSERLITHIQAGGLEIERSYQSLLEAAQRICAGLTELGVGAQEKVLFQFDKSDDFITAFWGCVLLGAVPVPVALPKVFTEPNNETNMLYNIWQILDKPMILTGAASRKALLDLGRIYDFNGLRVESLDELKNHPPAKYWHESRPEDPALIIFTSGSTGTPKGVVLTHRNVICRSISVSQGNGFTAADISMNWMPLEHVGGIVSSHIRDTYLGIPQVHVATGVILQEPLKWLDIVHRFRASITWAPNFAYGLISNQAEAIQQEKWDLSSMRFIINAGEAVMIKTIQRFVELLGRYGLPINAIHPAYGMSETSSGISYSKGFRPDLASGNDKYPDLGPPLPGASIRIVDHDQKILAEGMIGNIEVTAPTLFSGYYKQPELTQEVMTNDGWYRTGDLGYLSNGLLYITGRAKDVIIINGVNYNNSEIEAAVEEEKGVAPSYTAACAVKDPVSDTEKIAVFYHSVDDDFTTKMEQIRRIRKRILEKAGVKVEFIIPVAQTEIPKTNIGKIQRSKLAGLFAQGHFDGILKQIDLGLENENTLPAWFHQKYWGAKEIAVAKEPWWNRTLLIFEDQAGLGSLLKTKLESGGNRILLVKRGTEFQTPDPDHYLINSRNAGDYCRLFAALDELGVTVHDILFLYSFQPSPTNHFEPEAIREAQDLGIYSLLRLVQALPKSLGQKVRLYVITGNAQNTGTNEDSVFETATISGFLKCLAQEMEWLKCHQLDLEAGPIHRAAECVIKELLSFNMDQEIAYRKSQRLVPYLSGINPLKEARTELPIREGEVYLVTGGLGGIGAHVARWLLKNYRVKLILMGRTPLPDRAEWEALLKNDSALSKQIRIYLDLESMDGAFIYQSGDVSDGSMVESLRQLAQAKWGRSLAGVFHLAGMGYPLEELDRHWITTETEETYELMFQAKVYGALNLHQLLANRPDSLFVAFSSAIAFFGASGFSAYAAANSFLESFCLHRKNSYPLTYCLSFSMWDQTGMSAGYPPYLVNSMQARGYSLISPQKGLDSILFSLCREGALTMIGLRNSRPAVRQYMNKPLADQQLLKVYFTLPDQLVDDAPEIENAILAEISRLQSRKKLSFLVRRLAVMPLDSEGGIDYPKLEQMDGAVQAAFHKQDLPGTGTEQQLLKIWQGVLGKTRIGVHDNFFDLGGHSLNATTIIFRVNQAFQVNLSFGEIFKNPTIQEMARKIDGAEANPYAAIEPIEPRDHYPVSATQKRLFILGQFENIGLTYHISTALTISGALDTQRFEAAFQLLIKRHESLRTSFHYVDGVPFQKVHREVDFLLEYFTALEGEEAELVRQFIRPFELDQAPLLRAALIRFTETKHLLIFDIHHIIADGVSMAILIKDFEALYQGLELPALRIQYKDFAQWQNQQYESGIIKLQEAYWRNILSGALPVLTLPLDFPRPARRSFTGNTLEFAIPSDVSRKLDRMAQKRNVTLNTLLLAIYSLLLNQYSGQEDLIIGTLVAGRRHPDLEQIIGVFMNFLPVRFHLNPEITFQEFLEQVRELTLDIYEHQDYPFDEMVEKNGIMVDPSRNPLFDTMLIFHNEVETMADQEINGLKFSRYKLDTNTATLDLKMDLFPETDGSLLCWIQYNTSLLKAETIEKMYGHFTQIIQKVVANPGLKLHELNIFGPEAHRELIAKRELNAFQEPALPKPALPKPALPVVVAATFTAEPVAPYLKWWLTQFQEKVDLKFASYNQVFQELLDERSLISTNTGINILLVRFEDWIRDDQSPDREKYQKLERNYAELAEILGKKPKSIPYFIAVFPSATHSPLANDLKAYLEALYERWLTVLPGMDKVRIIDLRAAAERYQIQEIFDPETDKAGHLPFSDEFYAAMGTTLARAICSCQKPDYILPPETHTGKTLLKLPIHEITPRKITRAPYVPPENELEMKLVLIWQDILNVSDIGICDNFVDLGGHSLKAATLISRIHKEFKVELPLREVFQRENIKELAKYIKITKTSLYSSIKPVEPSDYYPVSSAQKRMFLLSRLEDRGTSYNIPGAMMIEGQLDRQKLEGTIESLIKRHDTLRTSFEIIDNEPIQRIHPMIEFQIESRDLDLAGNRGDGPGRSVCEISLPDSIIRDFIRPFDLSKAPLLRVALIQLAKEKQLLLFDMSHIISDGVSMAILMKEFAALYQGQSLPELKIQYKDFAIWQNQLYRSDALRKQEEYWLKTLGGELPPLSLPLDFPRPPVQNFAGSKIDIKLDLATTAKLRRLANETGATLYMVLLTVYNILLHKYTGQADIIVGSPVAGRSHADLESIIGVFVNTLAIRNYPEGGKTIREFLKEVRENVFQALEHQEYPFEELVNKLAKKTDPSRNPLFDTLLVMENMDFAATEIEGLKFAPYDFDSQTTQFDILFTAMMDNDEIRCAFNYCVKLFQKETMVKFAQRFRKLIEVMIERPDMKLADLELLDQAELETMSQQIQKLQNDIDIDLAF